MAVDRAAIERFLFHEARLMDEHRYDEWLALWAIDDAIYWIPANADDIDPTRNVSIIYDRRGQLRNRIKRLKRRYGSRNARRDSSGSSGISSSTQRMVAR
jgi:3-phenylpropionate/cinnamic acid dioxygenase small subunit